MVKFCTECGSKMNEKEQYCPSCGTEYNKTEQEVEHLHHQQTPIKKEKMAKGKKILVSLSLLLAVVAISGHFLIKSTTKPEKAILSIYNALLNSEDGSFYDKVVISEGTGYDSKGYMNYIKEQNMDNFFIVMNESATDVYKDGLTRIIQHEDGSELFRLKQKKFLFFYPTVEIQAIHTDVALETDLKEAMITFNNTDYQLDGKSIEIGAFLPGSYAVKASTSNSIIPNSDEWKYGVTTIEKVNTLSLMSDDYMISLNGEQPDSIVYVNGVSTKKTISELNQIGPIFDGMEIVLSAEKEMPTGEMAKSYEVKATSGDYVDLTYSSEYSFVVKTPEQLAEEKFDRVKLEQFVLSFRDNYESSLNYKDFALVASYLEPGTEAYNETVEFIGDIGDEYYDYNFLLNEVTSIELSVDEAKVFTYEEFEFTNHQNETVLYEREKQYDISLSGNGEFSIHKIHINETKRTR